MTEPLSPDKLRKIDAYWRAANYLSVGQIYLLDNPLMKEPLQLKHVKARLLGHWGTTPGQNFVYVHLNRIIQEYDLEHDLYRRSRTRRTGGRGQHVSRGNVQRTLSGHHAGRRRLATAVQAVLLPRRHSEPRRARNAGLDP